MEANTQFNIQQAFVATSADTIKIWKTIENSGMSVKATVNCSDGLIRNFQNSEMLVQYENPPRASIISLEIFGNCHEPYTTTTISLGNRSFFSSPVSISIRGEEATVAAMRTALTDTIDGTKPWYSRIATIDMFSFWFWILIIPFWLALMTTMESSGAPKPSHSIKEMLILMGISVTVVAFSQAVIQRINRFLKSLFPVSTFAIGQGMARHHHYEQVRWVVIIGFLVSVVASILVTILQTI